MKQTSTLIIGASISGLACAASLQEKNLDYLIIEKEATTISPWRRHYDRLHLHTTKSSSHLPYKKFDRSIPRYPSRQEVINYLEEYQLTFNIRPIFNTWATSVKKEGNFWITQTNEGIFKSAFLIMATGAYGQAKTFYCKGLETFPGRVIHSAEYKTGKDFVNQKVLVVGFGNSACEIAIDLFEQKAFPSISVRSPVNVIPREILGISTLQLSLPLQYLQPRLADKLSAPLIKWSMGDLRPLGLIKKSFGPLEEIAKEGKVPLIDIGTIRHIRAGNIKIQGGIDHINNNIIYFKDGKKERFESLITAIGYVPGFGSLAGTDADRLDDLKVSSARRLYFGKQDLYFCGYWISPTGQIREIGLEAKKIAIDIFKKVMVNRGVK